MNLKRQYNLPNCTLIVEGFSDGVTSTDASNGQPTLTIVTNAQCHLIGTNQVLQGGRTFLENLSLAVSSYAQELLSGVRRPHEVTPTDDHLSIEKISDTYHRLTWYPPRDVNTPSSPVSFNLSTVQLFDLVEAVDQFYTDQRTLPDVNLKLQPLSRRYRLAEEPITKKAVPMAVGLSSLAVFAVAFYFLPIPEVRKPDPNPQVSPTQTLPQPPVPGASPQ
ncbi:DUF4335 domain-containing protein [Aphanothece hegewaldii CCALA 016]|uniref:DUF4335 domain-containing protein n=1 Tax=Aphanothece hegewaldii CCALA 016 TaxID=2107694 RepID=A0A2T1LYY3_9CHRO|nr:DUF4335 domain-containing protein [Aphanothece hegewaldii]PSF37619.1 DUF4335 domain-containing protein [Aphanothece hegewaldii CCALA 016]